MKKSTRFFTFLLAIFMLVTLIPMGAFSAFAADENESAQGGEEITGEVVQADGSVKTKYGTIPEEYAKATDYPVIAFDETGMVVATGNDINKVLMATKDNANECVVIVRDDINSDTSNDALFQLDGKRTIDLMGHKVTCTMVFLFLQTKETGALTLVVKNGTLLQGNQSSSTMIMLYSNATNNGNKDLNLVIENVTFGFTADATAKPFIRLNTSGDRTITQWLVELNDCTVDLKNNLPSGFEKVFEIYNKANKPLEKLNCDIIMNGGTFKANTLDGITLGNSSGVAEFKFGKGSDGNYPKIELPETAAAPSGSYVATVDGKDYDLPYKAEATVEGTTTYTLDTSLVTPYGYITKGYWDANAFPFAVFKEGSFVGAYATFKEAMPVAANHTEKTDVSKSVLLMRADVALPPSGGYSNTGTGNKTVHASVTIDLGGHVLSHTAGPLIHNSSKTKDDASYQWDFTFKNGTIKKAFEKALFQSDSGSGNTIATKTLNFVFDNVIFETAEGAKTIGGTVLLTNDNKTTVEFISNVTFNDCTFKLTGAYLFSMGKDSKSYYNATFNGGKIEAASFNPAHLGSTGNGNTLTFGKGSDGKYITLTTPSTATVPVATYNTAEGAMKFAKTEVSGDNAIYTLINPVTEYGTIPDEYLSIVDNPFVVFRDGECKGGGTYKAAMPVAANHTEKTDVSKSVLLMRADFALPKNGGYANTGVGNTDVHASVTVDLGGHVLSHTAGPLIYFDCDNATKAGYQWDFTFKNGTIKKACSKALFQSESDSGSDNTIATKTQNFVFDNVIFETAEGASTAGGTVLMSLDNRTAVKFISNVTFNDCTFKLTGASLFSMGSGSEAYYNATFNGGKIEAASFNPAHLGSTGNGTPLPSARAVTESISALKQAEAYLQRRSIP